MTKFTCTTPECPNNGNTFETLDEGFFMECGGCQTIVEPDNE